MSSIVVVGSLAYDSISTPFGAVESTLGGSANYFSLAASHFAQIRVVGVVGEDYSPEDLQLLKKKGVDVDGIQKVPGKTFHWQGEYKRDMNEAITLATDLNVFEKFNPKIPQSYQDSEYLFLANIDPNLQMSVLEQVPKAKLVCCDTMNFWINSKLDSLKQVLKKVDVLLINEGEAMQLSQKDNGIAAARAIGQMGPQAVVVKRGEYGFILYFKEQYFVLPAFPIEKVVDPTGAGDTFAGGFIGYLAREKAGLEMSALRNACVHGCLMASFTVEGFGVKPQAELTWTKLQQRLDQYRNIIAF
jgi:sugar/nucleoside kinase (ribokinase family)